MIRSPLRFKRHIVVSLLLLGVVILGALWVTGGTIGNGSPSVNANVTERYRSIDAFTGTQTITMRTNGTVTSRDIASVTLVPGTGRKRIRFHNASDQRYDLKVSNGSTLWLHDTGRNNVTAIELTGPPTDSQTAVHLQQLVAAAGLTDDAGQPRSIGVSPLPVLPRHAGTTPHVDANRSYTVEFVKTDTVGGRDVYVLDITPATNQGEGHYRQRLWVDTERFYPLRKQTAWTANGTRRSVSTTYTNMTFDPQLPADAFRPEIDANTTVRRPDTPETKWYQSRADLKAQSSISVPNPTVPPAFELVYATQTTGRINGVGLRYAADGRELTVAKFNYTLDIGSDKQDLTLDGQPATLDYGPTDSLSWDCNGYGYTVRGTGVKIDRLIEVGRSVGCSA